MADRFFEFIVTFVSQKTSRHSKRISQRNSFIRRERTSRPQAFTCTLDPVRAFLELVYGAPIPRRGTGLPGQSQPVRKIGALQPELNNFARIGPCPVNR